MEKLKAVIDIEKIKQVKSTNNFRVANKMTSKELDALLKSNNKIINSIIDKLEEQQE